MKGLVLILIFHILIKVNGLFPISGDVNSVHFRSSMTKCSDVERNAPRLFPISGRSRQPQRKDPQCCGRIRVLGWVTDVCRYLKHCKKFGDQAETLDGSCTNYLECDWKFDNSTVEVRWRTCPWNHFFHKEHKDCVKFEDYTKNDHRCGTKKGEGRSARKKPNKNKGPSSTSILINITITSTAPLPQEPHDNTEPKDQYPYPMCNTTTITVKPKEA